MEHNIRSIGKRVIEIEVAEAQRLSERIGEDFEQACISILKCTGRVIVIGMGKSGHIGNKIAATLASTGTPAFFVHPAEASHGDLGMITEEDTVLMISNSGESDEILLILPILKRLGVSLIAMTGKPDSSLAQNADAHLDISIEKEACPLNLAPTSSTTNTLIMGDALAVALLESRGFTREDFARSHPAGSLGKKLLITVQDIMHSDEALPSVLSQTSFADALIEMSNKRLGMLAIVDDSNHILGVFTDGDLRRALSSNPNLENSIIDDFMTPNAATIPDHILAEEALHIMEQKNINGLLVVDNNQILTGALNMLDLVHAKVL